MKLPNAIQAVVILLLLIPTASAGWGATNEGGILRYNIHTLSFTRDNPATGALFNETIAIESPHAYTVESRNATLEFHYAALVNQNGTGVWEYTVFWDNVAQPCSYGIETLDIEGEGGAINYPSISGVCRLNNTQLTTGNHLLRITRATASGTPSAIDHESYSHRLDIEDQLEEDMENELLGALAVIAPLIIFAILGVAAIRTDEFLLYVMAILAGIGATISLWSELESLRVFVVGLTLYIGARFAVVQYESVKEG